MLEGGIARVLAPLLLYSFVLLDCSSVADAKADVPDWHVSIVKKIGSRTDGDGNVVNRWRKLCGGSVVAQRSAK